ncbi:unnamed protein product [Rotaria sp. Silwood2]|nr:unnamed protein product [Rotaria sp. Silwood2]CAF4060806.1 unnamed protein product [Rotaria sp. Silwood2]
MKSVLLKRKTSSIDVNLETVGIEHQFSICNLDNNDDEAQQHPIQEIGHYDNSFNSSLHNSRNSIQQETLTNTARATLLLGQDLVQYHANTKVYWQINATIRLILVMNEKENELTTKITKPGGKRPRRIDKESNKKYTSRYFSASQINTTNDPQRCQGDITSSRVNTSINSPPVIRALTGVSNLPSSSTSAVDVAPKLVRVIRFLTAINVTVPLPQSNQYVAYKP